MTIAELLEEMARLWPKNAAQVTAWARRYRDILGQHEGDRLERAWRETLRDWQWDKPPLPAVIAKALPEPESQTNGGVSSGCLPFGREHFDVCRHIAAQLFVRWHDAHRQWLAGSLAAAIARSEARDRARVRATELIFKGYRDAPALASLQWAESDFGLMEMRLNSQRRVRPDGDDRLTPGRLKPLHVRGLFP